MPPEIDDLNSSLEAEIVTLPHTPALHWSLTVCGFPSSQALPSGFVGLLEMIMIQQGETIPNKMILPADSATTRAGQTARVKSDAHNAGTGINTLTDSAMTLIIDGDWISIIARRAIRE